jgi:hypothetical protein
MAHSLRDSAKSLQICKSVVNEWMSAIRGDAKVGMKPVAAEPAAVAGSCLG